MCNIKAFFNCALRTVYFCALRTAYFNFFYSFSLIFLSVPA
jgi:hypothetical protein